MGDVGYVDDRGRLWFCGRKSHRVETPHGTYFTDMVEPVFNSVAGRTALVAVRRGGTSSPVLCVQVPDVSRGPRSGFPAPWEMVVESMKQAGAKYDHTARIRTFLPHLGGFPVDVRHNSKIFREKLAAWADKQLGPDWTPEEVA
jgi:hypothetical protein